MHTSSLLRVLAGLAVVTPMAHGQLVFDGNSTTVSFDGTLAGVGEGQFAGAGFVPSPSAGELDSNAWAIEGPSDGALAFGDSNTSGDYARGSHPGGVSSGGLYAFQVGGASDVALGFQATDSDMTPGSITLRIQNGAGGLLNQLSVSYDVYCYNNAGRSTAISFSYSADDAVYTPVAALDYASPEAADGTPTWVASSQVTTLTGLALADGAYLYLRWTTDDAGGSGSRDELAIDNVRLTVPEPAETAFVASALLSGLALWRRRRVRR